MQGTAQQWLVLQLSSDPLALGIVGALQFGPLLLLAPFGGIIADRLPRRNVLIGTQSVAAVLALTLWILTATGLVQLWHVFVLALLLGFVNAVDMPTRQAFVSEMVPGSRLLNAVSLNSAQFNVSRILGPGLAGALIALLNVPFLFLLNALSFVAVIAGLLLMRVSELVPVPRAAAAAGALGQMRTLGDGIRFIAGSPRLRVTLLMVGVVGTFGFNFNVLLPLEAHGVLQAGPQVFGLVSSALGAGALAGALLLARRRGAPGNGMLIGTAVAFGVLETSVALTGGGLLSWLAGLTGAPELEGVVAGIDFTLLAMGLIAATGLFMTSFSASANTRTQLSTPPELRGRVMSIYMMLFAGTTPIGNLLVSAVASAWGVPMAWVVSGVPCVAVALVAASRWRRAAKRQAQTQAQHRPEGRPATPVLADASLGTPSGTLNARLGDAEGALWERPDAAALEEGQSNGNGHRSPRISRRSAADDDRTNTPAPPLDVAELVD
jgi:MFS family permease